MVGQANITAHLWGRGNKYIPVARLHAGVSAPSRSPLFDHIMRTAGGGEARWQLAPVLLLGVLCLRFVRPWCPGAVLSESSGDLQGRQEGWAQVYIHDQDLCQELRFHGAQMSGPSRGLERTGHGGAYASNIKRDMLRKVGQIVAWRIVSAHVLPLRSPWTRSQFP